MGHSSVDRVPAASARPRAVRPDGTPVYRSEQRPGLPPVSVVRFEAVTHAGLAPSPGLAHDFLVVVYVDEGTGSVSIDGSESVTGSPRSSGAAASARLLDVEDRACAVAATRSVPNLLLWTDECCSRQ
jgi:hypothetical protein